MNYFLGAQKVSLLKGKHGKFKKCDQKVRTVYVNETETLTTVPFLESSGHIHWVNQTTTKREDNHSDTNKRRKSNGSQQNV